MNYYEEISKMLGVELGEEFSLKNIQTEDISRARYKITKEKGLMHSIGSEEWNKSSSLLAVFSGCYSIVKLPWKPKKGTEYWTYNPYTGTAYEREWFCSYGDLFNWKLGNCFRTKEEALREAPKIIAQIQKEYEEA